MMSKINATMALTDQLSDYQEPSYRCSKCFEVNTLFLSRSPLRLDSFSTIRDLKVW